MKLGFLTACMPERSLEDIAAWAGANGFDALELAAWPGAGNRPFVARHIAADAFDGAEGDRVRAALDGNGLTLSALAYYDNNLHPELRRARRHPRPPSRVHRRRGRARVPARRHVHRPRPGPLGRREPPRGRAGVPSARRLRRRARREADDRELRDGGLAPRRLPRQPRLLAGAVGVDVRARAVPELRSVAPAVARHRPRRRAAPVRRPRRPRARQGRRDLPRAAQPLRLLRPPLHPRAGSLGHGLVALPHPQPRRGRLPRLRRRAATSRRLRRRALGRARGPGLGRLAREGRAGPASSPTPICDPWLPDDRDPRSPRPGQGVPGRQGAAGR